MAKFIVSIFGCEILFAPTSALQISWKDQHAKNTVYQRPARPNTARNLKSVKSAYNLHASGSERNAQYNNESHQGLCNKVMFNKWPRIAMETKDLKQQKAHDEGSVLALRLGGMGLA
jgi:hypothetical protein